MKENHGPKKNKVVKCLSDTRWAARAGALKASSKGHDCTLNTTADDRPPDVTFRGGIPCNALEIVRDGYII